MLRVMSFNLRCSTANDGEYCWRNRREAVISIIEKYHPDLIGTQEGTPEQIAFLEQELTGYCRYGRSREKVGGEYSAIFLRKELSVIEQGDFWLSDTPDVPGSKHWGNNCTRMVTYCVVQLGEESHQFLTINTHLDHESETARVKGAEAILRFAASRNLPTVLTGDMNALPDSKPIALFKGDFQDAGEVLGKLERETTYHGYGQAFIGIIDYIFLTRHWTVTDFQILKDRPQEMFPSDHYPIMADLQLNLGKKE